MRRGEMRRRVEYVFGQSRTPPHASDFPTLMVAVPTARGWRVRSTDRAYSHDYVSNEAFGDVMEWVRCDLHRPFVAHDRQDAVNALVLTNTDSTHRTGFLHPGGAGVIQGSREEAEVVLGHLERGW